MKNTNDDLMKMVATKGLPVSVSTSGRATEN